MPVPECLKNCGSCPFAKLCRGESTPFVSEPTIGKVVSLSGFREKRVQTIQSISVSAGFPGAPLGEIKKIGCTDCKDGSCQKCRKAA